MSWKALVLAFLRLDVTVQKSIIGGKEENMAQKRLCSYKSSYYTYYMRYLYMRMAKGYKTA